MEVNPLPTRLVTCIDVAQARTAHMPTATMTERLAKACAYQFELARAKREIESGEWVVGS
jgi:hypothetical protein